MTAEQAKQALAEMSSQRQQFVLALWAHNLTTFARAAYPGPLPESRSAAKLRTFNELQHTLTGQLMHLATGNRDRPREDVLVEILLEKAQEGGCERDLLQAFQLACAANVPPLQDGVPRSCAVAD